MDNLPFWDEQQQLVRHIIRGSHTKEDAHASVDRYTQLFKEHPNATLLVTFTRDAKLSRDAQRIYTKMGEHFGASRIAVVFPHLSLRQPIINILGAGVYTQPIKLFRNETKARQWLNKTPSYRSSGKGATVSIFLLLLCTSVISFYGINQMIYEDERQFFLREVESIESQAQFFLHEYEATLLSLRAFFDASNVVDRQEWEIFTNRVLENENLISTEALGYIRKLSEEDLPDYITDVKADESFSESFRDAYQVYPPTPTEQYYISDYIAPFDESNSAYGFNLSSNDERRIAIQEAVDQNAIVASGVVDLIADEEKNLGILLMIPVYEKNVPLETVAQRRDANTGILTLVFALDSYLQAALETANVIETASFTVDGHTESFICTDTCLPGAVVLPHNARHETKVHLAFADSTWTFYLSANTVTSNAVLRQADNLTLLAGLIMTLLVTLLFHSATRTNQRAEQRAQQLTKDYQTVARRFRLAAEAAHIGVWEWNLADNTLQWDDEMLHMHGVTEETFKQTYTMWRSLIHPEDLSEFTKKIKAAVKQKAVFEHTFRIVQQDGAIRFIRCIGSVKIDADGISQSMTGLCWDMTHDAEVDRAKSEFVSLASHQLRTPLSSINWNTEMLLEGDAGRITKKQTQFLQDIYASSQRMVQLVNALLNVSRLDLGTFSIQPINTNLTTIAHTVLKELQPQIDQRQQTLTTTIDPQLPDAPLDPKLTEIILQNLLTNATKYTQEGGEISLTLASNKTDFVIEVRDNGIGIPQHQQEHIFTKLYRADNVRAKDTEGTGLGLYLVKKILDEVGGTITFTSAEQQGTTFTVTLPRKGMRARKGTKKLS